MLIYMEPRRVQRIYIHLASIRVNISHIDSRRRLDFIVRIRPGDVFGSETHIRDVKNNETKNR